MSGYFFDTSALVKSYHVELGTPRVENLLNAPDSSHFISRLSVVETQSVFAGKVRTSMLTKPEFRKLRSKFFADLMKRRFKVVHMLVSHYHQAGLLIKTHAMTRSLRTLDALQLSVALALHESGLIEFFVCTDKSLCTVASSEGLSVINPEQP